VRIRSIKPEFWRSDDIASLDWETRLFFIGLWSYVDDNGVGIDRLASIAADLFSGDLERDPPETFARVSRGLQTLSEAGRITRYVVENKAYLEITNWSKHQRIDKPNKPRFPRSDDDAAQIRDTLARVAGKEASGTGEQGNRGTGEQGKEPLSTSGERETKSIYSDVFEAWYERYPRKQSKGDAFKAWESLRKAKVLPDMETLCEAAEAYSRQVAGLEPKYMKLPGGWLRDHKWDDEALPTFTAPASIGKGHERDLAWEAQLGRARAFDAQQEQHRLEIQQ
jgi:hypothetical protein